MRTRRARAARSLRIPTELAVDGIDELIFGFGARKHPFASVDPPPQLLLRATDVDEAWKLTLE